MPSLLHFIAELLLRRLSDDADIDAADIIIYYADAILLLRHYCCHYYAYMIFRHYAILCHYAIITLLFSYAIIIDILFRFSYIIEITRDATTFSLMMMLAIIAIFITPP